MKKDIYNTLTPGRIGAIIVLCLLYSTLFQPVLMHQLLVDFTSFYSSAEALSHGMDPYVKQANPYSYDQQLLPLNLNPPIYLVLFQLFLPLGYDQIAFLFLLLSIGAGIKAGVFIYNILKNREGFNLKKLDYWLIYFSLYPVLINIFNGQVGFFVSFFILSGYQYETEGKRVRAGVLWGFIAAIKLFPLLLLIYAIIRKEWQLTCVLLTTFVGLSFLPLLFYSTDLYTSYLSSLSITYAFGSNWNGSLYGFLWHVLGYPLSVQFNGTYFLKLTYFFLFLTGFSFYWMSAGRLIKQEKILEAFNLTLVMMLLLSPLGWIYYFSLLLLPAYTLWSTLQAGFNQLSRSSLFRTYGSLMLMCCPSTYVRIEAMTHFATRVTLYSISFYGLLILAFELLNPPRVNRPSYIKRDPQILNTLLLCFIGAGVCLKGLNIVGLYLIFP